MYKLIIITSLIAILTGCKNEQVVNNKETGFSLTDTMLAHTTFATVALKQVISELKLFGKVAADNNKMAQVFPAVGGSVIKVNAELGDYVHKGQVLAVIRSGEAADYEKQLQEATNNLTLAEKNVQVAQDLYNGKLASEKELLVAKTELQKAHAELNRINEIFRIYNIGKGALYQITAPISGFIIDRNVSENMQLRSDRSENLFSIAEIDKVWVLANVNESDIAKISSGMNTEIKTIAYINRTFTGKIDKIFNLIDDNTKSMKARISIDNADLALKPEMNVTVAVKMAEQMMLPAVRSSAVIFDKGKNWVLVYTDKSHIETRQVDIYKQNDSTTYLKNGLNDGEKVISGNQLFIYDALND